MDYFARMTRNLMFLTIGYLLLVLSSASFASGTVSSSGTSSVSAFRWTVDNYSSCNPSANPSTCNASNTVSGLSAGATAASAYLQSSGQCGAGTCSPGAVQNVSQQCISLSSPVISCFKIVSVSATTYSTATCPSNATASGGSCSCNAGYLPNSGATACVAGSEACPSAGTEAAGGNVYTWSGGSSTRFCHNGCQYAASIVGTLNGVRSASSEYVTSMGSTCDATPQQNGGVPPVTNSATPASAPQPIPAGKCPGTVNGVSVIVNCSTTTENVVAQTTSTSPTGVTTTGSTTVITNTRNADGSITGTTTTYNPDGSTTTTTTTGETQTPGSPDAKDSDDEQDDFCATNPQSALCVVSSIGGTCAAVACSGDAIQCAMAREQARRNCELMDTPTTLSGIGTTATTAGNLPSDHPRAAGNITSSAFSIDQTDSLTGTCPGDMTVAGKVIPLSQMCGPLAMLGNVMVALAALACAFIVFRS